MKKKWQIILLIVTFSYSATSCQNVHEKLKSRKMDTKKSEKIVQKYQKKDVKMLRKTMEFSGIVNTSSEKLFPLLCPVREADWIPVWNCSMIYSSTGYAEDKCIFKTYKSNSHGEGLWTFTAYELNKLVEIVFMQDDMITNIDITLNDNSNGTTKATWHIVYTALNEKGNIKVSNIADSNSISTPIELLNKYLAGKMETEKSEKISQADKQNQIKLQRKDIQFSGTWNASPDEIFPLLCPAREADWIPTWRSDIIYSTTGYAEDKCIFTTGKMNFAGAGFWTFTGYKQDEFVKFLKIEKNALLHAMITVTDNKNGTTTATWHLTYTALNEKGNKQIKKMKYNDDKPSPVVKMIEHYLETGKKMSIFKLIVENIHGH